MGVPEQGTLGTVACAMGLDGADTSGGDIDVAPVVVKKPTRKKRKGAEPKIAADRRKGFEKIHDRMQMRDAGRIPVALVDLELGDCSWPVKDGFCGDPKIKGLPYCAPHCKRAYRQMPEAALIATNRLSKEPRQLMLWDNLP